MKALVFAAGLGTRLRPLTDDRPKALVKVAGRPLLQHVVDSLKRQGVDEIVINVHHFADQIIDYVERKGGFGIRVHISDESEQLLDTGGGILHARRWLEGAEPFIVHNADILTDIDLGQMYRSHVASGADVTLLVAPRVTSRYLLFGPDRRLCGWVNKSTGATMPSGLEYTPGRYSELAFGGVHVISSSIFPYLERYSSEPKFSITPFYVGSCSRLSIIGWQQPAGTRWLDVGKIESLPVAERMFG